MTKNLYEQPATTSYQSYQHEYSQPETTGQTVTNTYDSNQYEYSKDLEKYHKEGEYHVDYDP